MQRESEAMHAKLRDLGAGAEESGDPVVHSPPGAGSQPLGGEVSSPGAVGRAAAASTSSTGSGAPPPPHGQNKAGADAGAGLTPGAQGQKKQAGAPGQGQAKQIWAPKATQKSAQTATSSATTTRPQQQQVWAPKAVQPSAEVGLYKLTHGLKPPGFNPSTLNVMISWFHVLLSNSTCTATPRRRPRQRRSLPTMSAWRRIRCSPGWKKTLSSRRKRN